MRKGKLLGIALLFTAILAGGAHAPALAAPADYGDGAYTTASFTYYLNPDTGVTDDGGTKNAALGEGMCRSVVYETALVELDGGKIYATVRLQLMSNMKDFRLYVQNEPKGGYTSVRPRVIAEDASADTADYRFEIPSVTAYMSWEMYVIPMGRDVKFYMNLDDELAPGGADFIVSVKPKTSPTPTPTPSASPAEMPAGDPDKSPAPPEPPHTDMSPPSEPAAPSQTQPAETAPATVTPPDTSPAETPALAETPAAETPTAPPASEDTDKTPDVSAAPSEAPGNTQGDSSASEAPAPERSSVPEASIPAAAAPDTVSAPEAPATEEEAPKAGFGGVILAGAVIVVAAAAVIAVPKIVRKYR
ncbi:MAG: NEAT domain-containing protein [Oscillospiraceae bacterium]|jgi:hypothetical protein|nr:NEAT domain-containing protein [Oscillospiraceae bacterium]